MGFWALVLLGSMVLAQPMRAPQLDPSEAARLDAGQTVVPDAVWCAAKNGSLPEVFAAIRNRVLALRALGDGLASARVGATPTARRVIPVWSARVNERPSHLSA
jgi:hypothetical protein